MQPLTKAQSVRECFGKPITATSSQWRDDLLLSAHRYFFSDESPISFMAFQRCELTDPRCHYWAAVGGECFGLIGIRGGCIAVAETALAPFGHGVYVVFRLSNTAAASVNRWVKKWSALTKWGAPCNR